MSEASTPLEFLGNGFRLAWACRGLTWELEQATNAFGKPPTCSVSDLGSKWDDVSGKAVLWLGTVGLAALCLIASLCALGYACAHLMLTADRALAFDRHLGLVLAAALVFATIFAVVEGVAAGVTAACIGCLCGLLVLAAASAFPQSSLFSHSHETSHLGYISGGAGVGATMGASACWIAKFPTKRIATAKLTPTGKALNAATVLGFCALLAYLEYSLSQLVSIADAVKVAAVLAVPTFGANWLRLRATAVEAKDVTLGRIMFGGAMPSAVAGMLAASLLTLSNGKSPEIGTLQESIDNGCIAGGAIACIFVLLAELLMSFISASRAPYVAAAAVLLLWACFILYWSHFTFFRPEERPYTVAGSLIGAILGVALTAVAQAGILTAAKPGGH